MLPRLGHAVVAAAANGRELVELCREQKPDLIIADVRMPEMDGDVPDSVRRESRRSPVGANPTRPIGRSAGSNQATRGRQSLYQQVVNA